MSNSSQKPQEQSSSLRTLLIGLLILLIITIVWGAIAGKDASKPKPLAPGDSYAVLGTNLSPATFFDDPRPITYTGLTKDEQSFIFRDDTERTILVDAKAGTSFKAYDKPLRIKDYDANTRVIHIERISEK